MITIRECELNDLYKRVSAKMSQFSALRYGQAIFNEAKVMWPDEVERIRATDDDCFYDDEKVEAFLSHFKVE